MKQSKLAAVTGLAALLSSSLPLFAEEVIQVTANRTPEDKFSALAPLSVFNREAIEASQAQSLGELLNRVAGIKVTVQGTQANNASLFVRGGNSDHVLILIDGVRVGSASLGVKQTADLPLAMIERVEVVRGPRAALWGSDAIAGVIQIFTRQLQPGEGQAQLTVGSQKNRQVNAAVAFGNEYFSTTVSISDKASEGFDVIRPDKNNPFAIDQADEDGFRQQSLSINTKIPWSANYYADVIAQIDQGNTEYDASYFFGGDESDFKNHFINLRQHIVLKNSVLQMQVAQSRDSVRDNADKIGLGVPVSYLETNRDQLGLMGVFDASKSTQFLAGLDWYSESTRSHSRKAHALFLTARTEFYSWLAEASLRSDTIGKNNELTEQLAIAYQASDKNFFSLSYGTAFKAPTFDDLYWPDGFGSRGNPELSAETAKNTSLLYRHKDDKWNLELSVYRTDYNNLIEWQSQNIPGEGRIFQPTNIARVLSKGAELSVDWSLGGLKHGLALSHTDVKDRSTELQLLRRPYFTAFYNVNLELDNYKSFVELEYQGQQREVSEQTIEARTLLNLGLSYDWSSHISVMARVANLFDRDYEQAYEYPGMGRNFQLTLAYRFD